MKRPPCSRLRRDYPVLFGTTTIGVGDGWYFLLDSIAGLITKGDSGAVTGQVKEKFGTLRFYYAHGRSETAEHYKYAKYARGVVMMAEYLSGSICEECGAPGSLYGGGWYSARCDRHVTDRQLGGIKHDVASDHVFGLGAGWSRLVNVAAVVFANNAEMNHGPIMTIKAAKVSGLLVVTATGGEREAGAVALINHYGNRIDEHSGEPVQ